MTSFEAASLYVSRGLLPIPIPAREKAPAITGWPQLRLTKADLPRHFNGVPSNIGIILGDDYGTTDIDLDCSEALATAGELLPETAMIFGRQSKPASHYFYRADPPVRSKRFLDPIDKACLVELRCQKSDGTLGLQTVVPPSIHPSGELIRFEPGFDGNPANVDAGRLQVAVSQVAAASLLARHWPGEKAGRNQAFIALAGATARGGWAIDQAVTFHRAIYHALWGAHADFEQSKAEVLSTFEKHGGGLKTTGRRSLAELMEKRAVGTAFAWLGISQAMPDSPAAQPRITVQCFGLEDLMDNESIKVPQQAVEGLLPKAGLLLLGGRPKDGKSWFACQLALAMATGQALGGWLKILEPGRVQLWALEDQYALTKDKILKLLHGGRPDGLRDIKVFAEMARPLLNGGDEIIRAALQEHPAELIILDSLFKLTGQKQPHSDISQTDYDVIDRVRKIALEHGCAACIVMHTKKGAPGGNPVENLLGTSGITAAADAIAELKRFRQDSGRLTVVGRSVPNENYELAWHGGPDEWGWTIQDTGDQAAAGEVSEEILEYLDGQGTGTPAVIAAALRKSFPSVWNSLLRLQAKGKVTRGADKKWSLVKR